MIGHGNPAGDPLAAPHTVEQAVTLLSKPAVLAEEELTSVFQRLKACHLPQMPAMDSREEYDVFIAASVMFVSPARSSQAATALRHSVGGANFEIITAFLAFIRTAHYWTLTHPELAFESDMVALLGAQERLSNLLLNGSDAAKASLGSNLHKELVQLRNEHDDREALRRALADLEVGQRHQRLLINELNHRVKNTLAIVQSLAYQTLRGANVDSSVREAFTGRLVALAEAHDLLNTENWENASLQDVLLQAFKAQAPELVARVQLEGPRVLLNPKQALSIAMATHELTTNAIKYGALSNEHGYIRVCWSVAEFSEERWMELTWVELQGPEITRTNPPGFGTRLIQRGLAAELNGEATLRFHSDGVECVIRAPLVQEQ
ncbi:sensor histidine kinase [Pseudomonas sp. PS01301]|uniref:sensor histidine kinase n=1 Tax=Pseudomonas sp. PS01301 TaxID=2991437 RepID=UPI00249BCE01|nr:sensor histidine kinase [Pseudomonas sp. PS01301]